MTRRQRPQPWFPLPWERVLWSGGPALPMRLRSPRRRYHVTDFRVVLQAGHRFREIAVHEIDRIDLRQDRLQRILGTSTLLVWSRREGEPPLAIAHVRRAPQLALVLQLLARDGSGFELDESFVRTAVRWNAEAAFGTRRTAAGLAAALLFLVAIGAVAIGRASQGVPIVYPPDDAIYPGGEKRDREAIVAFMEQEVMPFARRTLGPLKGGEARVTCQTCHGADAEARDWKMPAVRALPEPDLRAAGIEQYLGIVDAQMRNAIYGYLAEADNQGKAGYMRGIITPGMADLLHRPAYDFTRSYSYNRSRFALGCYHCHMVH